MAIMTEPGKHYYVITASDPESFIYLKGTVTGQDRAIFYPLVQFPKCPQHPSLGQDETRDQGIAFRSILEVAACQAHG